MVFKRRDRRPMWRVVVEAPARLRIKYTTGKHIVRRFLRTGHYVDRRYNQKFGKTIRQIGGANALNGATSELKPLADKERVAAAL